MTPVQYNKEEAYSAADLSLWTLTKSDWNDIVLSSFINKRHVSCCAFIMEIEMFEIQESWKKN